MGVSSEIGITLDATKKLMSADISGQLAAGKESGKNAIEVGLKGGAEANTVDASVTIGAHLNGYEVTVTPSGTLLGAGLKGQLGYFKGKFEAGVKATAGWFGGGISTSVGKQSEDEE